MARRRRVFLFVNICATKNYLCYLSVKTTCTQFILASARQPRNRKIYQMVESMNVSSEKGDGNNVEEVFIKTSQAIDTHSKG